LTGEAIEILEKLYGVYLIVKYLSSLQ